MKHHYMLKRNEMVNLGNLWWNLHKFTCKCVFYIKTSHSAKVMYFVITVLFYSGKCTDTRTVNCPVANSKNEKEIMNM